MTIFTVAVSITQISANAMPANISASSPVAVIGAGPHGLSAVAHLRASGVPTLAFGDALSFWRETMPSGMWLRSSPRASSISDPRDELTIGLWAKAAGREIGQIVRIGDFIEYGMWFKERVAPDLDPRLVTAVRQSGGGFELVLADGQLVQAGRVVVAAGLGPFAHVPAVFAGLSPSLASHVSATPALEAFSGKSVAVIGAGQSALESAALLHECGAEAEVIGRDREIFWLGSWSDAHPNGTTPVVPLVKRLPSRHGAPAQACTGSRADGCRRSFESWVGAAPDVLRHFPRVIRAPLTEHCIRPAGAYWLPERMREVDDHSFVQRRLCSRAGREGTPAPQRRL